MADVMHVNVPPGIGDISWIHSKLVTLGQPIHYHVAHHKQERSLAYCEILKGVVGADVGRFSFADLKRQAINPLKPFPSIGEDAIPVNMNQFLEAGHRIEKAFPGMETDLHYQWKIKADHHDTAYELTRAAGRGLNYFGVYTSGGAIVDGWGGWKPAQWVDFIKRWLSHSGIRNWIPVLIGADYDKAYTDIVEKMLKEEDIVYVPMIGHHLGVVVSLMLRHLDFLIGFPSGICILANVCRVPCFMQYHRPTHRKLTQAWHDPEISYAGEFFAPVDKTFPIVQGMMDAYL